MSTEELTADEKQAFEAMQSDDTPIEEPKDPVEEVEQAVAQQEEQEAERVEEPQAQEKPPEGFVPHQAMHAERQRRQALEAKIAELEAKFQAQENPPEQPPQFVDPLEDPEGFRRYTEHQEKQRKEAIEKFQRDNEEAQARQQKVQEVVRSTQEFVQKQPDYPEAFNFVVNPIMENLRAQGYSEPEIVAQIEKHTDDVVTAAKAVGMNPAELLYMRATAAGYKPAANSNPAPISNPQAQITARAEAQKQTQGLGNVGGSEQSGTLTASQLADLSEAELAKVDPAVIAKAFGA